MGSTACLRSLATLALALLASFAMDRAAAQAAQAKSLPPDALKARISEPHFNQETIDFSAPGGQRLTAKVLVPGPRKLSDGDQKLPVLLVFGGFEEAAKVLDLLDPRVPMIVSSFDYPFTPPRRFEFPESFQYFPEAKRAIRETIEGIHELVNALKKRPDVDPSRITAVGASFGAPFVLAAAAENPGIAGIVLVHGFGDLAGTIEEIAARKWKRTVGALARPVAWLVSRLGLLYLNPPLPESSARKLSPSQRVLLVTARDDSMIPQKSTDSLWQALDASRASHERIDMPGAHLMPGSEKLIAEISVLVTEWMLKANLR